MPKFTLGDMPKEDFELPSGPLQSRSAAPAPFVVPAPASAAVAASIAPEVAEETEVIAQESETPLRKPAASTVSRDRKQTVVHTTDFSMFAATEARRRGSVGLAESTWNAIDEKMAEMKKSYPKLTRDALIERAILQFCGRTNR